MKKFRHIGIVVSDLERSIYFYRDLLGLSIVREMDESGNYIDNILSLNKVVVNTVKMASNDGNLIELLYFRSPSKRINTNRKINEIGYSHIAFTVQDIDSEYQYLLQKGVKFNAPPQYSPDGYAKVTFCKDPDGSLIELVEVLDNNE